MPKQNPNPTKQWLPSPQWRAESTLAAEETTPDPSPSPSPEPAQLEIHRIEEDGATPAMVFSNPQNVAKSIGVSNDGKDVTGQTFEVLAGEEVVLKGVVTSGTGSNWKWTAEGNTVKEFKVTRSNGKDIKGEKVNYKDIDLKKQMISLHWIAGGTDGKCNVTLKAKVGGKMLSATTTVKVKRPETGIKPTLQPVNIEPLGSGAFRAVAEIDFDLSKPLTEPGEVYWVQTAIVKRTTIPHNADPEDEPTESGLDGCAYPNSKAQSTADAPQIVFSDPPDLQKYFELKAKMFLLWKPKKPGIFIPLRSVEWHYKGKLRSTGVKKAPEWIPVDAPDVNPDFKADPNKDENIYPTWTKCFILQ